MSQNNVMNGRLQEMEKVAFAATARAEKAEDRVAALEAAWLTVCHEGNVPQYEGATAISPEAILHGVRQLASMWGGERALRKKIETDEAALRERVGELEASLEVGIILVADYARLKQKHEREEG